MPIKSRARYPFTEWAIAGAPADPGVYALWEHDELIYYGCAYGEGASIQARLLQHLSGNAHPCTAGATHYTWELCRDPRRREAELLQEHEAKSRRPRCNQATG